MILFRLYVFYVSTIFSLCISMFTQDDILTVQNSSENLSSELKKFGDKILGISHVENIYKTETKIKQSTFNASGTLLSIASRVGTRLNSAVEILRKSKDFIEHSKTNNQMSHGLQRCCSSDEVKSVFDSRFSKRVISETCCLRCHLNFLGNDSFDFYRDNLESSTVVLWQYFGDTEGRYFQYPADGGKMCNMNISLDNRFQDWYVHTASPQKKNVVIIIDASGSMSVEIGFPSNKNTPSRDQIAKEAANTVLGTLSSSDFIGIVAFNETAISSQCQNKDELVRASPDNKKSVKDFIQGIQSSGDTYYKKAFQRAFSFLNTSKKISPKQFVDSLDIILFLTDGTPSDSHDDILMEIQKGQSLMNNSVHIFIYGLGKEITQSGTPQEKQFLVQLADQNNLVLINKYGDQNRLLWPAKLSHGRPVGPPGNLSLISDADAKQLNGIMGRYYTQFPMSNQSEATISLPHNDPDVGQFITLGLPTMDLVSGEFTGVVALDISLELTFYEIQHFRIGRHSYAFLVNGDGIMVIHRDIMPSDRHSQPALYSVDQIEPLLSKEAVSNITMGIPGQESFMKQLKNDGGQEVKSQQVTYYYTPVKGYKGNYSVVLVIFKEDKKHDSMKTGGVDRFPQFVYHRLDYVENFTLEDVNICIKDRMMIMPNNATIKFSPSSFSRPEQNMMFEHNSSYSSLFYQPYNSSKDFSRQTGVMSPAAKDVQLTHKLDNIWMLEGDIIWRYMGTENGLFRVYPGTLVPDTLYDPREDTWYTTAMNDPDIYIFSKMDISNNNAKIVTVSKAFHLSKNSIHGVIAADISYHHFLAFLYNKLQEILKKNTDCFILDKSGIIMARFEYSTGVGLFVPGKHISHILPIVAAWLVNNAYMKPYWCSDFSNGETRMSYELSLTGSTLGPRSLDPCQDIMLTLLNRTNLFVLTLNVKKNCVLSSTSKVCPCLPSCQKCSSGSNIGCQCPCSCVNPALDSCNNVLNHSLLYRPCIDNSKHWRNFKKQQSNITNISNTTKCQESCTTITNATECMNLSVCEWCQTGHYKTMPLCSKKCIEDRINITLSSECLNLTVLSLHERENLLVSIYIQTSQRMKNYKDVVVHIPTFLPNFDITYMLENTEVEDIPKSWKKDAYLPLYITQNVSDENINLTLTSKHSPYIRYQVILHFVGINFTEVLESALTLRHLVTKTVKQLCEKLFSKAISSTVSDIWPLENEISFALKKPKTMSTQEMKAEISKFEAYFRKSFVQYDFFSWRTNVRNVTIRGRGSSSCNAPCHLVQTKDVCDKAENCKWDIYQSNCSRNAFLPERIEASVYFPCMSLYSPVNKSDLEDMVSNFEVNVRKKAGGVSHKAFHSFFIRKVDHLIGRQFNFTLQGTMRDSSVSETWWLLKQELDWPNDFHIGSSGHTFRGSLTATSYWQFTHMQIVLEVPSLDIDDFLKQNPLNGRREITHAVQAIADRHLLPSIASTMQNVWVKGHSVPFLIWKPAYSVIDLQSEYNRLKESVDKGQVNLTVLGHGYPVDGTFFIGSFNAMCPRNCTDSTSETVCGTLPGCYWSEDSRAGICEEDALLPERYSVTVLFPCSGLDNLTHDELKKTTKDLEKEIRQYINHSFPDNTIHSFQRGQDFEDSLTFTVQSTIKGPSLKSIIHNLTLWLSEGHLQIPVGVNGTYVRAKYVAEYDSAEVALQYRRIDFSVLSLGERRSIQKQLQRQITDLLSAEFTLVTDSIWFYQNFFIFTFKRVSKTANLKKEVNRLRTLSGLGSFGIKLNGSKIMADQLKSQGKLITDCPVLCRNGSRYKTCKEMTGCFYKGVWHSDHCGVNKTITKRYSYEIFIPCNATQRLNSTEIKETEADLQKKVQALFPIAGRQIVKDTVVNQDAAYVILQANTIHPSLDRYIKKLRTNLDYTAGFAFGPLQNPTLLIPRDPSDYTNIEIELEFGSIDLGVLQTSGKASFDDIAAELHIQLNKILLAEMASSCKVLRIHRENILFSLKKSADSFISMSSAVKKIQKAIDDHSFILSVHYIRPVKATAMSTTGSFKEICPEKHPVFTSVSPTTIVTSRNFTETTVAPSKSKSSVIVIYNASEVSTKDIYGLVPDHDLGLCFVEITSCQYCMEYFSWKTCHFLDYKRTEAPKQQTTALPSSTESPNEEALVIGPVQITIMAVSGLFLLALALWAIEYVRQMSKKSKKKSNASSDPVENRSSIEEVSDM